MLKDYTKLNVNTSCAAKEVYFSLVISSHRTVATITYKLVDTFVNKIKVKLKYSPHNLQVGWCLR